MSAKYKSLISVERLRKSTGPAGRTPIQQIGSDRGRILFSAPFRRLQSKAQVFSLESNAAVRSRLTHSMEVAHIGRYIVQRVALKADANGMSGLLRECKMIEEVIETACLLHDIGNPPFGHLGESAIQEWFKKNAALLYAKSTPVGPYRTDRTIDAHSSRYKDIERFDGNPQGLRICLRLQGLPSKCGFNLTHSQIASLVKYPKGSDDISAYKKNGVFTSELELLQSVWNEIGLEWGARHPLVFLMEAADDIAYCLSDIEDGIEKNIISEEKVIDDLSKIFSEKRYPIYSELLKKSLKSTVTKSFVSVRTQLINELVDYASIQFVNRIHKNMLSDNEPLLDGADEACLAIKDIKAYCRKELYRSAEAEDVEIAGFNIVYGLLEKFSVLLELPSSDFIRLVEHREGKSLCCRMFSKLPDGLVAHYKDSAALDPKEEWFFRAQLIIDYVSGMTDDFALKFFRLVHGIDVKVI